jgi:peptide-methionine (R)-S-oxide reductase
MDRRRFLKYLPLAAGTSMLVTACSRSTSKPVEGSGASSGAASDSLKYVAPVSERDIAVHPRQDLDVTPIETPKSAWKERLAADAYQILFEAGTEPRGTSPLLEEKRDGTFICKACHLPLFPSTTKYESGTGWPSFWAPLPGRIETMVDRKLGYPRTEYHCRRCKGHQGHIFSDGPDPTGLRYCNNGLALKFVPADESLPALRA